jgi:monoamine oxidase
VWSRRLDNDEIVEMGAEWIMPSDDAVAAACADLGVALAEAGIDYRRREPRGERASTLDEQDLLLRLAADARRALDPERAATMTLGEFLRTLPARAPALAALRSRLQGTCAIDLDVVALRAAEGEDAFEAAPARYRRAATGNQTIAIAMGRRLGDVRLRHRAERVVAGDGGVAVRGRGPGAGWTLEADAVVVAVPPALVRELAFDPPLPADQREALARQAMGSAAKLAVATAGIPPLRSVQSSDVPFWCWTARGAGGRTRAAVTSFAGSRAAQEALQTESGDPTVWLAGVRGLVPEIALAEGHPLMKSWGDDDLARGSYSVADNASYRRAARMSRPLGRVAFAGEHTGVPLEHGTMEAAVRSGAAAARVVSSMLR